jgi:NAD-dependent dihydropyrimidine dehydrogenase PreA subunit
MLTIEVDRCSGCGACVEVCAQGAISLVDGAAQIDPTLCTECRSCVAACPTGAIRVPMPITQAQQQPVVPVRQWSAPVVTAQRGAVATLAAAALTFVGRHLLPLVAQRVASALGRQSAATGYSRLVERRTTAPEPSPSTPYGHRGRGRQYRRRGR